MGQKLRAWFVLLDENAIGAHVMRITVWILIVAFWCIPVMLFVLRRRQIRRRKLLWRSDDRAFAEDIRRRSRNGEL